MKPFFPKSPKRSARLLSLLLVPVAAFALHCKPREGTPPIAPSDDTATADDTSSRAEAKGAVGEPKQPEARFGDDSESGVLSPDGSGPGVLSPDDSGPGVLSPDGSGPEALGPETQGTRTTDGESDDPTISSALEDEAQAGQRREEPDGVFPPGGADLLALLGRVSADSKCRFPDRRGTWSRRVAGATWTPGFFPGDARRPYQLALTFDDGPDSRNTEALLRFLKDANIKATFFVVGQQIHAATYTLIQQVLREGHVLGNHSFRHDTAHTTFGGEAWGEDYLIAEYRFTQIRVDMAFLAKNAADFRASDRRIFGADGLKLPPNESAKRWPEIEARYATWLGERGYAAINPPARMLWARPPGGNPWFGPDTADAIDQRAHIARAMRVAGMAVVLWDIDTRDWWHIANTGEATRDDAIADAVESEWARGGVALFHDRVPLGALQELQRRSSTLERPVQLLTLNELALQRFGCSAEELASELTLQNLDASIDEARRR